MFIGRKKELQLLENLYESDKSELAVIYGRRRIGKSSLIEKFSESKKDVWKFEAIEGGNTHEQIKHFTESLKHQSKDPLLTSIDFKNWEDVFTFLTERIFTENTKLSSSLTRSNGWPQDAIS